MKLILKSNFYLSGRGMECQPYGVVYTTGNPEGLQFYYLVDTTQFSNTQRREVQLK